MTVADDSTTVRLVFDQASEITDFRERAAFLDRACAEDRDLRAEVEGLLDAHEEAGGFLADVSADQRPGPAVPAPEAAERIGPYTLLQRIGEGGCGVVYLAEQLSPVRRQVALKIIKLGMDTRQVIARFEAERQALALMDHPNIAKVLDAGTTETGRPYFVMELVRGIRITDFCEQNQLATPQRLELFIKICQAIQHAHQKGIIHRDLKPSNILVTLEDPDSSGAPKVIDFGIAKAMDQPLTDKTVFTAFEQFMGTPAYMSPEQAQMSATDIDTRSDIYSLGVLLYELLTGKTPFDIKQLAAAGIDELRRTICEREPVRPSTRLRQTQPVLLSRAAPDSALRTPRSAIESDLDWIVMKCLEKDRARRYETANGLAMDLRRHLNNEPVVARPPTAAYRFQKAWRRNRLTFSAGAAVAAALLGALVVSHWQIVEARKARNAERAQRLAADAEKAEAQRLLYGANLNLIQKAWEDNNLPRVRQLLDETRNSPGRGFEWYYWQRQTHLWLRTLPVPGDHATAAHFSPDGRWILTGSVAHCAQLWDAVTGGKLVTFDSPGRGIYSADLSPDARWIVTSGEDREARIWETATGREVRQLKPSDASIWSSAFAPDGKRIVTGCATGLVKLWEAATGRELLNLPGHTALVWSVAFSPNGRWIVSGSHDRTAKVWDAATGREVATLKGHTDQVWTAVFSPDSQRVLTASSDGTAKIWDAASGREVLTLRGHTGGVGCAAFSPDGRRVATGSADATVKFWEAATGRELFALKGHTAWLVSVAFSPDGKWIVTTSGDYTARIWRATEDQLLLKLDGRESRYRALAFSPDGKRILTAGEGQTPRVWDAVSRRELLALPACANSLAAAFSPDGRRILAAAGDSALVCDSTNGQELLKLPGHKGGIRSVACSPDGRRILTGGNSDGMARLWDAENGRELHSLMGSGPTISAVVFSPDSRWAAFGSGPQSAAVWNTESGREAFEFTGHGGPIFALRFSPDGRWIASGSRDDSTARIWAASTGKALATLYGHHGAVPSVAFSPDGTRLVTGSHDRTAKVWEIGTGPAGDLAGHEPLALRGHSDMVQAAAFSPDGQSIATASGDQTVTFWYAPKEQVAPPQEE